MDAKLHPKDKLKYIFSRDLREQIVNCGICSSCKKPNTGYAWCNKCDPGQFLKSSSSGNSEMDNFIKERQVKTKHYYDNMEWIPYDRFKEIKFIGEGGCATIHSAIWEDGAPKFDRNKGRTGPIKVALKKLKDSKNMTEAFINEIRIHNECNYANFHITRLYGITKDPKDPNTNNFMMVLEYAENGNLRDFLKTRFSELKWNTKLEILRNIIDNLEFIHHREYVHKDLHSGNILQFYYQEWCDTKITDLGLAQSIDSDSSNICGVLPYIAPEVLDGKPYTFASDVYSFGIIMVEVSTGRPPYGSVPHDEKLALAICNGLRPRVAKGTPQCYIDLVNQCLKANPTERPSAKEILKIIRNWRCYNNHNKKQQGSSFKDLIISKKKQVPIEPIEMLKDFIDADKNISQESTSNKALHPNSCYVSRSMRFTNLPKSKNSIGVQIEDPDVPDSNLVDLHVIY